MATYRIKPGELAKVLGASSSGARRALDRGVMRAAQRGKRRLIQATEEKKIPYLGQYKNSFQVAKPRGEVVLFNDAPHAGIVELGARPHPVSEEGIQAIAEWVKTKLSEEVGPAPVKPKRRMKASGPLTPMADQRFGDALASHEGAMAGYEAEARRIAEAIAHKIRLKGQVGKFVFRDELPMLQKFLAEEVNRSLQEFADRGPGGKKQ